MCNVPPKFYEICRLCLSTASLSTTATPLFDNDDKSSSLTTPITTKKCLQLGKVRVDSKSVGDCDVKITNSGVVVDADGRNVFIDDNDPGGGGEIVTNSAVLRNNSVNDHGDDDDKTGKLAVPPDGEQLAATTNAEEKRRCPSKNSPQTSPFKQSQHSPTKAEVDGEKGRHESQQADKTDKNNAAAAATEIKIETSADDDSENHDDCDKEDTAERIPRGIIGLLDNAADDDCEMTVKPMRNESSSVVKQQQHTTTPDAPQDNNTTRRKERGDQSDVTSSSSATNTTILLPQRILTCLSIKVKHPFRL